MPVAFELADASIHEMAREIMLAHHDDLKLPDGSHPRLCIMLASSADADQPAVQSHGYPCYAVISVIPYKQRVDKRADAEIIIDKDAWLNTLTEPQQRALLDHEIQHLEIQKDGDGFMSPPPWGRGLKPGAIRRCRAQEVSPPPWGRGLKPHGPLPRDGKVPRIPLLLMQPRTRKIQR